MAFVKILRYQTLSGGTEENQEHVPRGSQFLGRDSNLKKMKQYFNHNPRTFVDTHLTFNLHLCFCLFRRCEIVVNCFSLFVSNAIEVWMINYTVPGTEMYRVSFH
jgi:hypothetical protein